MEYVYDKITLVPLNVKRDTYDEVAADFLNHYGCAQYIKTPMPVPIFDIARKRMGLTVNTEQLLSESGDTLGTIAFFDGEVEVYDPGTKNYIAFGVKQGTVLIDFAINHEGRENNTMAHECVHYYIHRHYFQRLREKVEDYDIAFRCPARIGSNDSINDEERMERQARGIAPRILMPKESTTKKLREIFAARAVPQEEPARIVALTEIVDELANFYHVSRISAKYRMVDLGFMSHDESAQIYNFNTTSAIEDFAAHPLTVKTSNRPLTRHISLEQAFYEFSKNDGFRELLQGGMFRYVNNAFIINHQKYLYRDESGTYNLTPYAIKYPQECTLIFEYAASVMGDDVKFSASVLGFLMRVETDYKKLPRFHPNVQNDAVFDAAKALDIVKEEFDKFSSQRMALEQATDFWDRVEQIKTAKGIQNNIFKDRSGLDDATISRIKLKKTTVTLRVAIAACFGLDLDIEETKRLLALAKLTLNNEQECLAYEFVITNFQFCPLFEKNDVLQKLGVEPIGVRSKEV